MREQTLTAKEIGILIGITDRAIRKRANKYKWEYTLKPIRGGMVKKYPLFVLPKTIQIAHINKELHKIDEQIKSAQSKKKKRLVFLKEMEGDE